MEGPNGPPMGAPTYYAVLWHVPRQRTSVVVDLVCDT